MTFIYAFLVGGALCAVVQILIDRTKLTPARILSGAVVVGVFLSAVGLYEPLVGFAGAGVTLPLTGFGHLLAKGTREAIDQSGAVGILTGGLTASAAGIAAAMVSAFLCAAVFSSKPK